MNRQPNILLIMCDQFRADALQAYGNEFVYAPNLNKLAEQGVVFTNAYSETPVCMPARYGLLTGKNPCTLGMWNNFLEAPDITDALPHKMKRAGYYTCAVGKMHFSPVREHYGFDHMFLSEEIPQYVGDDEYLTYLQEQGFGDVKEPHGERSENYYKPQISDIPAEHYSNTWIADKTIDVMKKNKKRPFFIFSSFIKPHPPFNPNRKFVDLYADRTIPLPIQDEREKMEDTSIYIQNGYKVNGYDHLSEEQIRDIQKHYYACITQVDEQIGRILDELEKTGLGHDTLVIFTSDHGEMLGDHRSFGKRTYFESSAKIPLILKGDFLNAEHEQRKQLVTLEDIYNTIVHVGQGSKNGKDLYDVCNNPDSSIRDCIIGGFGSGLTRKYMVRTEECKYIYHVNGGKEELYFLDLDRQELHNAAKDKPQECCRMKQLLKAYLSENQMMEDLVNGELRMQAYTEPAIPTYLDQHPQWPDNL